MIIGDAMRGEIEELTAQFPERRGGLLSALHAVQREHGWISPGAARELAEIFGLRPNDVMEVVSFYDLFDAEQSGRHQVRVCTNLPCALRGGRTLLSLLAAHLDVSVSTGKRKVPSSLSIVPVSPIWPPASG